MCDTYDITYSDLNPTLYFAGKRTVTESNFSHTHDAPELFIVLSGDLAIWMDGVICDYNYVFDPNVCLKRFFGENVSGNYLFLIDEAHNLVDRGREMYSASICLNDVI